jgi:hypothetical protein
MTSPLDSLHELLRSEAAEATHQRLDALVALRRALDEVEAWVRDEVERGIVARVAGGDRAPGRVAPASEEPRLPRVLDELEVQLRSAIAWLSEERARQAPTESPTGLEDVAEATIETEPLGTTLADEVVISTPSTRPTQAEIRSFFDGHAQRAASARPPRPAQPLPSERATLRTLLEEVGPVPDLRSDVAVLEELENLEQLTEDERTARWDRLEEAHLQPWLTLLVARLRALKQHLDRGSAKHAQHTLIINRLPSYRARRGLRFHVNGMDKRHEPTETTWHADAADAYETLLSLARAPESPASPAPPSRASARSEAPPPTHADPAASEPAKPARTNDPAAHPKSGRVVLFGGDAREPARRKLEQALHLAELRWEKGKRPRQLDALLKRLPTLDAVLITRFVAHKESQRIVETAKAAGVPFRVISSYGLESVREALRAMGVLAASDDGPSRG